MHRVNRFGVIVIVAGTATTALTAVVSAAGLGTAWVRIGAGRVGVAIVGAACSRSFGVTSSVGACRRMQQEWNGEC